MDSRLKALIGAATLLVITVVIVLVAQGGGDDDSSSGGNLEDLKTKPVIEVPDEDPPTELVSDDIVEGDGAEAKTGDNLTVDYVGVDYETGEEFDTSWGKDPFQFQLGSGNVIPGWDQGLVGMKVGGRRELTIPPDLAYGPQGSGPIGPDATLIFVIDLKDVG